MTDHTAHSHDHPKSPLHPDTRSPGLPTIRTEPMDDGADSSPATVVGGNDGTRGGRGGLRPSAARPAHRRAHKEQDFTSEAATAAFVRRTLCAHGAPPDRSTPRPLEELLPPLTSSNEVDMQLYGVIAAIFRDYVLGWYARITPDHAFVDEALQVIAHCTRALEQRLRKVDLEALLLDELPALLEEHVRGQCRHLPVSLSL